MHTDQTSATAAAGTEAHSLVELKLLVEELVGPVNLAIHARRFLQAQKLWQAAQDALGLRQMPVEFREALHYRLYLLQCHLRFQVEESAWNLGSLREVEADLAAPAHTQIGERERVRSLLTVLIHADQDGLTDLTPERFNALLGQLPVSAIDGGLLQALTVWAFKRRYLPLLARAFEENLINPDPVMGAAKWQRINLMYQLGLGKATRRDVLETLRTLAIAPQVQEFVELIWPECVKAGLVDAEMRAMLADREAHILAAPPVPQRERRTKFLRTGPAG